MERILLIEDDQALGRGTALALAGEGREIRVAATLAQGWTALGEGEYALVLLDLNLPDGNGLDFLTALRRTSGVPVLILTANDLESDQVAGLELGADDYVTKPFSMEEVMIRLHRLVQRSGVAAIDDAELVVGDLVLNQDTREVTRGGEQINLTATQFDLLRYLMENAKRVVSKSQILDNVWNYDFGGQANIVELYISYLRKKIDVGREPMIHTVRGAGYVLRPAV